MYAPGNSNRHHDEAGFPKQIVRQSNATDSVVSLLNAQTADFAVVFKMHSNCAFTKQLTTISHAYKMRELTNYAIRSQHGIRCIHQTETRGERHSDE